MFNIEFFVDDDSGDNTSEEDFHSCLEDVMTLPQKLRNLRDGSLFLSDDPKAPDPEGEPIILPDQIIILIFDFSIFIETDSHDNSSGKDSYSCLEDVMTIPRKLKNLRSGCLVFNDQPKKPTLGEGD